MWQYLIFGCIWLVSLYYLFLLLLENKVEKLEEKIVALFQRRADTIPALYECTTSYLTKHESIFEEILRLRKHAFSFSGYNPTLHEILPLEKQIHHELNFIFDVCHTHNKLQKDARFLYTRDILLQKSHEIWKYIELYKHITQKLNTLIMIKNLTVIGLFLPIERKYF